MTQQNFSISTEMEAMMLQFMQQRGLKLDGNGQFASPGPGLDRLVRKEDALGTISEIPPPTDHIGLQMFPFLEVDSDDIIFNYLKGGLVDGMTPARAEDAESELSQKDDLTYGQGRASIIDWAEKDKYTASDVTRYRENLRLQQLAEGAGTDLILNSPGNAAAQFQSLIARDEARRSRKLYNRIEWLIQQALWTGGIAYNDGKIKFAVDFQRPAGQQNVQFASGFWDAGTTHDPIGDVLALDQAHYDVYGVHLRSAITSKKVLNTVWRSDRWMARAGIVVGGTPSSPLDLNYINQGWSPEYAIKALEDATGITFSVYDSVYRTRPIGSSTITNTRYSPEKNILFLPDMGELGQIDDTEIGFGRVLTSPHPEANFASGFYEWEDETKDPWMHWRGTGVKAFPIFPHLEYSVTAQALT
jgi:hypothetical protein